MKLQYIGSGVTHEVYDKAYGMFYVRVMTVWYAWNEATQSWNRCRDDLGKTLEDELGKVTK